LRDQALRVDESNISNNTEGKVSKRKKKLDDVLLKAIDDTLKDVFKEAGTKVIYNYLESNPYLRLEEITEKPELFSDGLKKLLGSAAPMIEELILKNLYTQLESEYEDKEGYEFPCYIKELKEKYR